MTHFVVETGRVFFDPSNEGVGLEVLNERRHSYNDLVMRSGKSLAIAIVATRFNYEVAMRLKGGFSPAESLPVASKR